MRASRSATSVASQYGLSGGKFARAFWTSSSDRRMKTSGCSKAWATTRGATDVMGFGTKLFYKTLSLLASYGATLHGAAA